MEKKEEEKNYIKTAASMPTTTSKTNLRRKMSVSYYWHVDRFRKKATKAKSVVGHTLDTLDSFNLWSILRFVKISVERQTV